MRRTRLSLLFGFILMISGMAVAQTNVPDSAYIKDVDITHAIESHLQADPMVADHMIDVKTTDGIVTLSGQVDHLLAQDRAVEQAKKTKGVRAVVNNLDVKPVFRSDSVIKTEVSNALFTDPAADSYELDVTVNEGTVTLSGAVESWPEKQLAAEVAKSVLGVRGITNKIQIESQAERSDMEILTDVQRQLESDIWVDETFIDVSVDDGNVILTGTVGSAMEKTWATSSAWVQGVDAVDASGLQVKWWLADEMKRDAKRSPQSGAEIQQAIMDALLHDPRVNAFNPVVVVRSGVATLSGKVDNLRAKRAAEQDAANTVGVWRVKNYIKVRPVQTRPDTEIESAVHNVLENNPYLNAKKIDVDVLNGKAYISGVVNWDFEKEMATDVTSNVKGVIAIENNLIVNDEWVFKSDRMIKEDVNDNLFWNPALSSVAIDVSVDDGAATLQGVVNNWYEYRMATQEAYEAGARTVDNDLEIKENFGT